MLTFDHLRTRISQCGAESDILSALDVSGDLSSAPDASVMEAFVTTCTRDEDARTKLLRHPLPNFERLGIYTGDNPQYHLAGGFGIAHDVSARAEKYGLPLESTRAVLDFGCGTSRVLRYLVEFLPGPQYYASEVFQDVVEWGRAAFPEVEYIKQSGMPPLPLPLGSLDIIYAFSIYSHFSIEVGNAWMAEFHRILRPGGLVIFTIQSKTLLDRCKREPELVTRLSMTDMILETVVAQYEKNGFAFHQCYDGNSLAAGGLDASTFGLAYMTADHMHRSWSDRFQFLEHDEGAVAKFQDWVVLRKPVD